MIDRISTYIGGILSVLLLSAGCEQANIYSEVDFNVTLDPSNTYYAGEPVLFNISGNPDNLLFYSGEQGHQYEFRNRYEASQEDVNSMVLDLSIQHRQTSARVNALEIYYTNQFDGLLGNDGPTDIASVQAMYEAGMEGWVRIPYDKPTADNSSYDQIRTDGLEAYADNFCLAFFWCPPEPEETEDETTGEITYPHTFLDTYWVNGDITVDIEGTDEMTYTLNSIMGQTLMYDSRVDPYMVNKNPNLSNNNGCIRFNTTNDIAFVGGYYDVLQYYCTGWAFSVPRSFAVVNPDEGVVVKNLQNYVPSYEYTFSEPGTYTVTFVGVNENYIDASELVKELTVTILPPKVGGGAGDSTVQE